MAENKIRNKPSVNFSVSLGERGELVEGRESKK